MIETKFIRDIVKEFQISEFIEASLNNVGFSHSEVHKTPLGEKIIIYASRPGLVVGRKGENIQKLTKTLKARFKMENPQIEIVEVEKPMLNANIVAERIASSLERFGLSKFKGIGHKMLTDVMDAGAQGIEILISGKIPSSRAKRWRFYQGYLKKSGDIAVSGIKQAYAQANLKTGIVGIQVRIMPPDLLLPDKIVKKTEVEEQEQSEKKPVLKKQTKKKSAPKPKKKSSAKSVDKEDIKNNDDENKNDESIDTKNNEDSNDSKGIEESTDSKDSKNESLNNESEDKKE
ncbi:MAG: 30S ribosomal protein S3 [Candidatus Woesearchaeota archaeon]